MRNLFLLFWLFQVNAALAQNGNLVPNPSFEEFTDCPNTGNINDVESWVSVRGSVDYYHECAIPSQFNNWGVPYNWAGYQEALTGQAYIGLAACASPLAVSNPLFTNAREFAGVSLKVPLTADVEYQVAFHVNLLNTAWYAIKNIGAYLSLGQPSDAIEHLLSREPQVRYEGEDFLDDKEGWTRISGTFIAQGGENFITIGNFDDDDNTDTLQVVWEGDEHPYAAYYIDDVSVIDVDSLVGVGEHETEWMSVYPNPANVTFTIEASVKERETVVFELYTVTGALVKLVQLQNARTDIDASGLNAGLYFFKVIVNDRQVFTGKQVIVR